MPQPSPYELFEPCDTHGEEPRLEAAASRRPRVLPAGLCVLAAAGVLLLGLSPRSPAGVVGPAARADLRATVRLIDWDRTAKLPPWLSPIKQGARKGVAIVCGQSLKPDGSRPQVLVDRARMAKSLLDSRRVEKVIVTGSDPAGVGHTEASEMAGVLRDAGIPADRIIQESQATTTAENAWFALRWIPRGTGQLYIVTSDFHMPRATYIFQETLNYFYKMVEDKYRDDPRWLNPTKRYPRLTIHQAPTASFCGNSTEGSTKGDINEQSLAKRAMGELQFLGSGHVAGSLYGPPRDEIMVIWPIQIRVEDDPENAANFARALAQAANALRSLCRCTAPPEGDAPSGVGYPLAFPISGTLPAGVTWKTVRDSCDVRE